MKKILIKNGTLVNEGKLVKKHIIIQGDKISAISELLPQERVDLEVDATGCWILPGLIDDQVHFREPGLTHKADIFTESRAAVAGGITSFMEMPNTVPNALTQQLLADKYVLGAQKSLANYSFFMGAGNDNLEEVLKTDPKTVCGIKIFMGSSTGNMLVDNKTTLQEIFKHSPCLIATHCEDELTVRANTERFKMEFGNNILPEHHPLIRSAEACYLSSSMAVELAHKHGTRLHVLHISTAKETSLFERKNYLNDKRITAEACIHHLWFTDADYKSKGNWIKWNPAVKTEYDRQGIWDAVLDGRIDVIATDHAPHTIEEKSKPYLEAPSGGPLVQHALLALLDFVQEGKLTIEQVVEKTSHNVAELFNIDKRGFIREGYFADLVVVDPTKKHTVTKSNLLYKCGWSPFEGHTFSGSVTHTFVNGHLVFENGVVDDSNRGMRLTFNR